MTSILIPHWPVPSHIHAMCVLKHTPTPIPNTSFKDTLQLPSDPVWLNQKHTANVMDASKSYDNAPADASFTDQTNTVCAIMTADCLPLLISNQRGTVVAAIHGGWRGLAQNIIQKTLTQLPFSPHEARVWLGPAIGPDDFEVGEEVREAFISLDTAYSDAFITHKNEKYLGNLYQIARHALMKAGVLPQHIYASAISTYGHPHLCYSYRRDKTQGRLVSLLWISGA